MENLIEDIKNSLTHTLRLDIVTGESSVLIIEHALLTAKVLQRGLMCDQVITVTPFDISETLPVGSDLLSATPGEAVERILTIERI
jgi:hypothetical protein